MDDAEGETDDPCNLSCLVAVGRILKPIMEPSRNPLHRPVTFISRHAIDGKFVFVDQRTTLVVGFLPQELLGTSMYEYFHQDDISSLADVHKAVLLTNDSLTTALYRFRTRDGNFVKLHSTWKVFRNPWTRDIEYIIAKNDLASFSEELMDMDDECADDNFNRRELDLNDGGNPRSGDLYQSSGEYDFFSGNGISGGGNGVANRDIQRLLITHVPFRKIGEQIADEVTDSHGRSDTSSSNSPVSLLDSGQSSVHLADLNLHQNQPPSPHPLTPLLPETSVRAPQQPAQVSNQSNQAVVPQRQVTLHRNACSVSDGEISSTGLTGASQSERAAEGLSALSSRTSDPVIGSAANTANISTTNIVSRLIRANGNNNNILNGLENDPNVLNDNDEEMLYMIGDSVLPESPHQSSTGDGNDEAAMAVIMSLLEADAGLGGPVDFSGLPWPLP